VATSNLSASEKRSKYSPDGRNYGCIFWGLSVGYRKLSRSYGKMAMVS
jgi:hypothetical protein